MLKTELHNLVWTMPTVAVAERLGVSDVAVAKACKRAGIPMPGRGYWQRIVAGKKSPPRIPLPPRLFGEEFEVTVGGMDAPDKVDAPLPPIPEYESSSEEMSVSARSRVSKVVRTVGGHVSEVTALLEADAERDKDSTDWDGPMFASQFEQRRLALISKVAGYMRLLGQAMSIRGKNPFVFPVRVGDVHFDITIDSPDTKSRYSFGSLSSRTKLAREKMAVSIVEDRRAPSGKTVHSWVDDSSGRLERRLAEIVNGLLKYGEDLLRERLRLRRDYAIERREYLAAESRRRLDREAKDAEVRRACEQKEKIGKLVSEANAYRLAGDIRSYVATIRQSLDDGKLQRFEEWADWANAQADSIDPVLNRAWEKIVPAGATPDDKGVPAPRCGLPSLHLEVDESDSHWNPWYSKA